MELKEQINKDFIAAFKEGVDGRDKKNFLGVLKGEIQTAESKKNFKGDETVLGIVKKMEKSLKENGDDDSLRELTYIEGYLPTLMSEEEIGIHINAMIAGGATNIGMIMKQFNSDPNLQADNKIVSKIAKELLN
jgi:uncharacterized protein YqeY